MKNFDFVELIGSLKDLDNRKIYKGSKGTIIELKNDVAVVIFFNDKNLGDYAVANVKTSFLKKIGEFPKEQLNTLVDFIKNINFKKDNQLKDINVNEYDLVELLVEDEKYSKCGVHKGNKGFVISDYAIQNKVEVDFTWVDKEGNVFGDIIVADIKDLKVLN